MISAPGSPQAPAAAQPPNRRGSSPTSSNAYGSAGGSKLEAELRYQTWFSTTPGPPADSHVSVPVQGLVCMGLDRVYVSSLYIYIYIYIHNYIYTHTRTYKAMAKRSCLSGGAKGMLTRCVHIHSFSLRAGIAYADAYASLHGPGFCFCEVLIATPQQK